MIIKINISVNFLILKDHKIYLLIKQVPNHNISKTLKIKLYKKGLSLVFKENKINSAKKDKNPLFIISKNILLLP